MNQKFTARVAVEADTAVTVQCHITPISGGTCNNHNGVRTPTPPDISAPENRAPTDSDRQNAPATDSSIDVPPPDVVAGKTTPTVPPEPTPNRPETDDVVDELVAMLKETLIDESGDVYCRLPTDDGHAGVIVPLRDRRVASTLYYLYHKKHGRNPRPAQVNTAIHRVEGELVSRMRSDATILNEPTWRCLKLLLVAEPSGAASADELLKTLRDINKKHKIIKGKEDLPLNPTAMGKWLSGHQFALRNCGVEISRPTRRAAKRLWAWQAIDPDDTSDTSLLHLSAKDTPQNKDDSITDDTMSDAEASILFGECINDTEN